MPVNMQNIEKYISPTGIAAATSAVPALARNRRSQNIMITLLALIITSGEATLINSR